MSVSGAAVSGYENRKLTATEEKEMLAQLDKSPNFQPSPSKSERGFFDKMKDLFN